MTVRAMGFPMACRFRNALESDIEAITSVYNQSMQGHPVHRGKTPAEMRLDTFDFEDFDPAGSWICHDEGIPIAYGDAIIERPSLSEDEEIGFIGLHVVPSYRGKGIEEELVSRGLAFAEAGGVRRVRAYSFEGDVWRRMLLESFGFVSDRRFFSMVSMDGPREDADAAPEGVRFEYMMLREAKEEDLEVMVGILNESFREHYGFIPATVRELRSMRDAMEDLLRITFAKEQDVIIGLCMSENSIKYNEEHGTREGWIDLVGVLKDHRRKGLGRAMIVDGMHWLVNQGITTIRLGVDAENRLALGLYTSLGFDVAWENIVYLKHIRGTAEHDESH